MDVQIFGTNKSQDTKKALRFFKERGLKPHFVDLHEREIAMGELNRFIQKFGLHALIDMKSKAYKDAGLEHEGKIVAGVSYFPGTGDMVMRRVAKVVSGTGAGLMSARSRAGRKSLRGPHGSGHQGRKMSNHSPVF